VARRTNYWREQLQQLWREIQDKQSEKGKLAREMAGKSTKCEAFMCERCDSLAWVEPPMPETFTCEKCGLENHVARHKKAPVARGS
jgi:transcription initiation factor IIE alpha subunit